MNYQLLKVRKSFFSAPTFRGSGHGTAHYPFFKIDFERLARYCEKNNAVVLFKMHPFVKKIDLILQTNINNILLTFLTLEKLMIYCS